jgi:hypothetical protein
MLMKTLARPFLVYEGLANDCNELLIPFPIANTTLCSKKALNCKETDSCFLTLKTGRVLALAAGGAGKSRVTSVSSRFPREARPASLSRGVVESRLASH